MSLNRFRDVFAGVFRDGKLCFIILASLLVSISLTQNGFNDLYKSVFIAVPYGFAWVVFAWAITDKSVFRRPLPYIGIFLALFLEKMYWSLNVKDTISSSISTEKYVSFLSKPHMAGVGFEGDINLQYVFLRFIVVLFVFMIIWYLSRPKDFKKNDVKASRGVLVFVSSFFMIGSYWLWELFGDISSISYDWYLFLFIGFPVVVSFVFLGFVLTNIKSNIRYYLYCGIGFFAVIPFVPFYKLFYNIVWNQNVADLYSFVSYVVSFFGVFLCLLLLSKSKYIE